MYTVGPTKRGIVQSMKLEPSRNTVFKNQFVTIAEELKKSGYSTLKVGKWDFGPRVNAKLNGFGHSIAEGFAYSYFPPYGLKDIEAKAEDEFLTERLTDDTIDWINTKKDSSFFVYLSYFMPH